MIIICIFLFRFWKNELTINNIQYSTIPKFLFLFVTLEIVEESFKNLNLK